MQTTVATTQQPAQRPAVLRGPRDGNLQAEMAKKEIAYYAISWLKFRSNLIGAASTDRACRLCTLIFSNSGIPSKFHSEDSESGWKRHSGQVARSLRTRGEYMLDETMSPSYNISEGDTWGAFDDDSSLRVVDMSTVNHAEHDESM